MLITPNPSIEILQAALEKKGYTADRFELDNSTFIRFTAPNGQVWITQGAHVGYPFTPKAVGKISGDKNLAYDFCANEGVRVPKTVQVTQLPGDAYLAELLQDKPVIVKPHNSSLSRGVTLNITEPQQLLDALEIAMQFSPIALVQEQIEGEELRFTVVDGKAKAALLRQKPRLIGDGVATIKELFERENAERSTLKLEYLSYPQLPESMLGEVPRGKILAAGEALELSRSTMIRTGASVYNVIGDVDESYVRIVESLAQKMGASFIVVDMMLRDYKAPKTDDNYAFIEFNTAPVLKLFYSCRDGKQYDVVSELADMIDATLTGAEL